MNDATTRARGTRPLARTRSRWLCAWALAATTLTLAACSGGGHADGKPGSSTATTKEPTTPTPPPISPTSQPPSRGVLTLSFAGDLNFDQQLGALLDDPQRRLATALRPLFAPADLSMLNFETAITQRGTPQPKSYHFRVPASALDVVAGTGVDLVTMANNHAADYGSVGFADTLAARDSSPLPIVGIGRDAAEAFAPAVFHVDGVSVAFLGSTEIDDLTLNKFPATDDSPGVATNLDPTRLLAAVRSAARRYDLVVVYLHWGLDYTSCPDSIQPTMAKRLSAAGADIIVGSHAHRVEAGGWLGDSYVDYGLGNFVWARNDDGNGVSGVLTLSVSLPALAAREQDGGPGRRTTAPVVTAARWTPLLIGSDGIPRRPDATTSAALARDWRAARSCADVRAVPTR